MRLDNYLVENKIFDSRTKAKQSIERGEVYIDGVAVTKPSLNVSGDLHDVKIVSEKSFVSLGGYKLDKALNDFDLDVKNLTALDVGASTGGFTDCLLQRGAKTVYAVDLNDDLLHQKLKEDNRVISIIKNARSLSVSDFNEKIDILVADLSFISATLVLETFANLLENGKKVVLLIKPQFETGERKKFKNGIIRDQKIRDSACEKVISFANEVGFIFEKITTAPIVEQKNLEYLVLLTKSK